MNEILWALSLTVAIYLIFWFLQIKTKQSYLNPLLLSSLFIMLILIVFKIDYDVYKKGTAFITFLIGPATVSLAIPLYENLPMLKKHWKIITLTLLVGVIVHATMIGTLAIMLNVSKEMLATFIPKSVTTAIAMDVAESLGGIKNLTIAVVIITGILGAMISPLVFKIFKIESPIAKGLSLGISAHAVGTAKAAELGGIEASMASLALIITGFLTVLSAPLVYYIFSMFLS